MSESSHLIPNLNKIMEDYVELENEIVQATQVIGGECEERAEVNEELEQSVEESRNRKRAVGREKLTKS